MQATEIIKKIKLILLFCLAANSIFFSQKNDQNNKEFLDDGRISNAKSILKVNLTSPIFGEFSVFYENAIYKRFGIEIGVGKVFSYFSHEYERLFFWSEIDPYDFEVKNGYSFWINPRIYLMNRYSDGPYVGLIYRNRLIRTIKGEKVNVFDYSINSGSQFYLKGRFFGDFNIGLGFQFTKENNVTDIAGISVPVSFKIGYYL